MIFNQLSKEDQFREGRGASLTTLPKCKHLLSRARSNEAPRAADCICREVSEEAGEHYISTLRGSLSSWDLSETFTLHVPIT